MGFTVATAWIQPERSASGTYGREEKDEEDGHLHRPGLERPEPCRDTGRPAEGADVEQEREREQADDVDAGAENVHPEREGDRTDTQAVTAHRASAAIP